MHYLYERDDDLLSEDAILEWADEAEQEDGPEKDMLSHPGTKKFIEWLRTAEEDDDEDDDD